MAKALKGIISLHLELEAKNLVIGGIARLNRYVHIENVKYPDGTPYIPGSSLKGRLRMLIEHAHGIVDYASPDFVRSLVREINDKLEENPDKSFKDLLYEELLNIKDDIGGNKFKKIVRHLAFFESIEGLGMTRLHFSDLRAKKFETTIDARNLIDRLTGVAKNPRLIERISGTFEGEISILVIKVENKEFADRLSGLYEADKGLNLLRSGFLLLKNLGIGRGVSRGNGRIESIKVKKIEAITPVNDNEGEDVDLEADDTKLREKIAEKAAKLLETEV